MARRSDHELLEEHRQRQAEITERMARKADPLIDELKSTAKSIDKLIDAAPALGDDIDKLEVARTVLNELAKARIADFASRAG